MCILLFDYEPDGSKPYLLIAANNRDEFYDRKTAQLDFWSDYPDVLAGRDLQKGPNGGTWIGVSRKGRFSVLTNWRKSYNEPLGVGQRSRGLLVSEFLQGSGSGSLDYCHMIMKNEDDFEKFNLIVGDFNKSSPQLAYCTNVSSSVRVLNEGVYTLSNEELDTPWAKTVEGRKKFESIISQASVITKQQLTDRLFDLLCDTTCYHPDPNVRDTGHSDEWMRGFNSVFVRVPSCNYGTRTNSVILIDKAKEVTYTERTMLAPFNCEDPQWSRRTFEFKIQ